MVSYVIKSLRKILEWLPGGKELMPSKIERKLISKKVLLKGYGDYPLSVAIGETFEKRPFPKIFITKFCWDINKHHPNTSRGKAGPFTQLRQTLPVLRLLKSQGTSLLPISQSVVHVFAYEALMREGLLEVIV